MGLKEVAGLALCALVGHFTYWKMWKMDLECCMEESWAHLLGYVPVIKSLSSRWHCFIFKSTKDLEIILEGFWQCGSKSLMLRRWHVGFNAGKDYFVKRHIWVMLPGLPLHFWNPIALRNIGNQLGVFHRVEESLFEQEERSVAKLYVEIDTSKGIFESLDIKWHLTELITNLWITLASPLDAQNVIELGIL